MISSLLNKLLLVRSEHALWAPLTPTLHIAFFLLPVRFSLSATLTSFVQHHQRCKAW